MTFATNDARIFAILQYKTMTTSKIQAIQTALNGDWNNAILLNKELLLENPKDIETLNRLALAFTVIGKIKDAKETYQKVLALDNQNPIALKNIKRLTGIHKMQNGTNHSPLLNQNIHSMFLEENGKTKVIELVNIAEPKVICNLMTGEGVILQVKRLKIFVLDAKKQYIGMLPDDIGKRLIKFIKGGNAYEAAVKAVLNHRVIIFIKEVKRVSRFKHQPSFLTIEKSKISIPGKQYATEKEEHNDSEESDDHEEEE